MRAILRVFTPAGLRSRLRGSIVFQAAALLPVVPRRKLVLLVLVQVFLGALDLIAVALVGLLGTLAVANAQAQHIGQSGTIGRVLSVMHLDGLQVTQQIMVLAGVTGVLFIGRTIASIYLTRRALHFLGIRAAMASADLVDRLLQQPITFLQSRTTQEFIYTTTTSTNALVLGVLGTIVIMAADASMLIALGALMLYASPIVALAAGALLGGFVAILHRFTTARAQELGAASAVNDVESRDLLTEALATYRDMQVRGSQSYYSRASREVRLKAAAVTAEWSFLPNVSKYVMESAVIVGALVIGGLEFAVENVQRAVGVLTLFLAAGTRLAPAMIRLQQGATTLRWSAGQGLHALRLQSEMPDGEGIDERTQNLVTDHQGFDARIALDGVSYSYPGAVEPAVSSLNLQAEPGALIAIVGPSGAGKSTVADLLLGVLTPSAGNVSISGLPPRQASMLWPGAIAYVPQDVWIADGSVRKNVALGFDVEAIPDEVIWQALEAARLAEVVRALPNQLDEPVGERGAKLSGGQRQRLGIARALLTQPELLVLDEATSALDASTEHDVTEAIRRMHGTVTVVVIAHRLATVRLADRVLYLESGRVRAGGAFDEVRAAVPDFQRQATLLGL